VTLEETDRVIRCDFCRVHHVIVARAHPVLHIPPRLSGEILYAPYWRFRGAAYTCAARNVRHKLIDSSRAAIESPGLPFSLGLRAQTQPLRFVQPATEGGFLRPQRAGKELFAFAGSAAGLRSRDRAVSALVGDILSLVYAPVILDGGAVLDGLTGGELESVDDDALRSLPRIPDRDLIRFLPALCPACGWDLRGNRDGLAHFCEGCDRSWIAESGGLAPIESRVHGKDEGADLYIPVWELEMESEDLPAGWLAEVGELTGSRAAEGEPFVFRVPAFKINPKLFLRLSRQAVFLQKQASREGPGGEAPLYPVSLPASEAAEALPVLICHLARNPDRIASELPDGTQRIRERRLLYLPFRKRGPDYVQLDAGFAVPARALFFARGL
jgi:hypothetical protein